MNKIEILAPVGNYEMLRAAIDAGADAVYFGVRGFNMRARAHNFKVDELKEVVKECHKNSVKAYLALNTIIYDDELGSLHEILFHAKEADVDAVICWDMAVVRAAQTYDLEIHLSTQASVSNIEALEFYYNLGIRRFVLARELSLEQIALIAKEINRRKLKAEIEVFVHGAMCVSISGRCFMSHFLFGTSANRGQCLQPCRRAYIIKDPEEGYELEVHNNYVLSPKDLCTMPFIDKIIEAGVTALKIEGRARSPEYVKITVECYKRALELYEDGKLNHAVRQKLTEKLNAVYNRGFSSGFYLGKPLNEWSTSYGSTSTHKKIYVGKVKNFYKKIGVAEILIEAHDIKLGDTLLIVGNKSGTFFEDITEMQLNNQNIKNAQKGQSVGIKFNAVARPNDKVYLWVKRVD